MDSNTVLLVSPKKASQKLVKMAIVKIASLSLHQTLVLSRSYSCLYFILIWLTQVKNLWLQLWFLFFYLPFFILEDLSKSLPCFLTHFIISGIKTVIHNCHLYCRSLNVLDTLHLSLTWEVHEVEKSCGRKFGLSRISARLLIAQSQWKQKNII